MSPKLIKPCLCLAIALGAATTGCSSLQKSASKKKDSKWSWSKLWKEEFQEPSSIAAIWSFDTLATENKSTERGFGGRIYFYNEKSQAVPVNGDLTIYGYVTTPGYSDPEKVEPDQKFDFKAEQLASHFSPSEIGASYSVWVPWDRVGGHREEITLIPTFKSEEGSLVQGTPAKVFLEGTPREKHHLPGPKAQTVSYRRAVPTEPSAIDTMPSIGTTKTTTIEVPGEASLGRSRRRSFTLGAGRTNVNSTQNSFQPSGFSVGGGKALPANAAPKLPAQNGIPSDSRQPGYQLRALTPPQRTPGDRGVPAASPRLANASPSQVQPAAFQSSSSSNQANLASANQKAAKPAYQPRNWWPNK
ncbi:MAG: hypothetical protein AAGG44_08635 [Planctomycetota bacterium]